MLAPCWQAFALRYVMTPATLDPKAKPSNALKQPETNTLPLMAVLPPLFCVLCRHFRIRSWVFLGKTWGPSQGFQAPRHPGCSTRGEGASSFSRLGKRLLQVGAHIGEFSGEGTKYQSSDFSSESHDKTSETITAHLLLMAK